MGLRLSCCNHYPLRCYLYKFHATKFVDSVSFLALGVPICVALVAQTDKIVQVKSDLRIVDCIRSQRADVMDFLGLSDAPFLQAVLAEIPVPA